MSRSTRSVVAAALAMFAFAPVGMDAQRATDSATTSFEVNGLRVIHRRVTANDASLRRSRP